MLDILGSTDLETIMLFFLPKIMVATLCGGLIGIDQQLRKRDLGFKPNILICIGTTIFTATCLLITDILRTDNNSSSFADPLRVIAQIITGIGFIGAGAIFKDGEKVKGLTSAAFIWVNCSLGIIIGAGGLLIASIIAVTILFMTLILDSIENQLISGAEKIITPIRKPKAFHRKVQKEEIVAAVVEELKKEQILEEDEEEKKEEI